MRNHQVDILVCGAGPAGIFAAMAAAKSGASVLLVESAGRLGGTIIQAMVNQTWPHTETPFVRKVYHQRLEPYLNNSETLDLIYADLVEESGARILLHGPICQAMVNNDAARPLITGVQVATAQGPLTLQAKRVVDATGDGTVAFLAGAAFDYGRERDGQVQPVTCMFRVSGVRHEESMDANGGRKNYRFEEGSWEHVAMNACKRGELPPTVGKVNTYMGERREDRYINAIQVTGIDATDSFALTRAELEARRQVPILLDFLRRRAPGFQGAYVSAMPASIGVRETRRFRCVHMLNQEDLLAGRTWNDAIAIGCRAPLDIHNPTGPGQAGGVSEEYPAGRDPQVQPYDIPYGCLVPEATDGLLLAGRCIGGTHEAHASYRFQIICMATGAAAGFAAAQSLQQDCLPRDIDVKPVQQALGIDR